MLIWFNETVSSRSDLHTMHYLFVIEGFVMSSNGTKDEGYLHVTVSLIIDSLLILNKVIISVIL